MPINGLTIRLMIIDAKYVKPIPINPDVNPIINVSAVNKFETSFLRPPSERITPISFVRSTTETYVIIAIITLETTNDNAVNPIKAIVITLISDEISEITIDNVSV